MWNQGRKKINALLKKRGFKVVFILKMLKNIKIFNSYFVDKIKNIGIINIFEKLRWVVKVYNNHDKKSILIQSSII